jgi:hypothetical protein
VAHDRHRYNFRDSRLAGVGRETEPQVVKHKPMRKGVAVWDAGCLAGFSDALLGFQKYLLFWYLLDILNCYRIKSFCCSNKADLSQSAKLLPPFYSTLWHGIGYIILFRNLANFI